jgi:AbrB family looped-hinge helix DNA binding protein
MSETTRITRKGQTTIPQELRERYGLEPGDTVVWKESDEGLVVRKRDRTAGRGMLADGYSEEERRELAAALTEEIRRKQRTDWTID